MIFSLEALQAFHGDSLLVHAGTAQEPVLLLIDGGPSGTWETSLHAAPGAAARRARRRRSAADRPRDGQPHRLRPRRRHGRLRRRARHRAGGLKALSYEVGTLWHNSFDDILGNDAEDLRTAAVDVLSRPVDDRIADEVRAAGLAVVASVAQGRELRQQAEKLGWSLNEPFDGPVVLPEDGVRTITLGPLKLTVVCPHAAQLKRLHAKWEEWLEEHPKAVANPASAAVGRDNSPYNLSSIVVLAECDGKTMLLTGDARDDHVLAGLDETAVAKDGKTHVDILKLPHHGSIRNMRPEFFDARHRRPLRHLGQRARRQPRDRNAGADRRRPPG